MRQLLSAIFLLALIGCSTTISFEEARVKGSRDPDTRTPAPVADFYALEPVPADIDERLSSLVDVVVLGDTITVHTGRAVRWVLRQDAEASVRLNFGESRVTKAFKLAGLFGDSYEVSYSLYLVASVDGGPPQNLVASARSASADPRWAVQFAVENCMEDLRAQVANLQRTSTRH